MIVFGSSLVGVGVALFALAAAGVLRFPDVLTRASAATKAAGLGLALVLGGVAVQIGTLRAFITLGVAIVLQFVTAPVAGHVLARAAFRSGAPLWDGTRYDADPPGRHDTEPPGLRDP